MISFSIAAGTSWAVSPFFESFWVAVGYCRFYLDRCGSLWVAVDRSLYKNEVFHSIKDLFIFCAVVVDRCRSLWVNADCSGSFLVLGSTMHEISKYCNLPS